MHSDYLRLLDREETTKESDFVLNEDDDDDDDDEEEIEEWDGAQTWNPEAEDTEDVKDESAIYLQFLKEEVSLFIHPYIGRSDRPI